MNLDIFFMTIPYLDRNDLRFHKHAKLRTDAKHLSLRSPSTSRRDSNIELVRNPRRERIIMIQPLLDCVLELLRRDLREIVNSPDKHITFGSPAPSTQNSIGIYPSSINLAGYAPLRDESPVSELYHARVERASECTQEFFIEIHSHDWSALDQIISLTSGILAIQLDPQYAALPLVVYRLGQITTEHRLRRISQLGVDYLGAASEPKARLKFQVDLKFTSTIDRDPDTLE